MEKRIKISDAVNMYIDESRQSSKEFRRLWVIAFRGLTDIGLDVEWTPKSELIQVNDNKTVTLPIDYIDWVKVGVFNMAGEMATLKVNNQLSGYHALNQTRLSEIAGMSGPTTSGFEHGSGLVQSGECKVLSSEGVIILDPNFSGDTILLEYIASPILDSDYTMDLKCQEALIAWLRWKDIQSLPATKLVNLGEKRDREREYQSQKKLAKKRVKPFRLQEAEQYARENIKQVVKG